jgi:hypothetical protein
MADTVLAVQEKTSFSYIDNLDTADGTITLTCLESKPTVDLNMHLTER